MIKIKKSEDCSDDFKEKVGFTSLKKINPLNKKKLEYGELDEIMEVN